LSEGKTTEQFFKQKAPNQWKGGQNKIGKTASKLRHLKENLNAALEPPKRCLNICHPCTKLGGGPERRERESSKNFCRGGEFLLRRRLRSRKEKKQKGGRNTRMGEKTAK